MRISPTLSRGPLAGIAPRWGWRPLAVMLLICAGGCARASGTAVLAPRLTPAREAQGVRLTMTPVTRVPVSVASTSGAETRRIRWHSYGPGLPPERWPLIQLDGVALGVRSDGTTDHLLAQRLFQQVKCDQIVSIHWLKREEAVKRFGSAWHRGAFLIVTAREGTRANTARP